METSLGASFDDRGYIESIAADEAKKANMPEFLAVQVAEVPPNLFSIFIVNGHLAIAQFIGHVFRAKDLHSKLVERIIRAMTRHNVDAINGKPNTLFIKTIN